jgi:hypothetical protein
LIQLIGSRSTIGSTEAGLFERVVRKLPVVVMVMLNLYAILRGEGLEGAFGGDGLDG